MTTALATLRPQSLTELRQFAHEIADSELMPKDYRGKPGNIIVAIQMGSELGLSPMQSLQNISVINSRPSVWGDAMPALCMASGVFEDIQEHLEGEDGALTAVCTVRRKGVTEPFVGRFSMADAKTAGLADKQGPWKQYPKRMLQLRARTFALRDAFPDVLRGLTSVEEAADMQMDTFTGPTIDAKAEPQRAAAASMPRAPVVRENAAPNGNGRRSVSEWLDAFEIACRDVDTREAADRLITSEESLRVKELVAQPGREKNRDRYNEIITVTMRKWFADPPTDDELPEIVGEQHVAAG